MSGKYDTGIVLDARLLLAKVARSVVNRGLSATFREAVAYLRRAQPPDDFDLKHGTDTVKVEPLWKFKIDSPNASLGYRYEATGATEFAEAIHFLDEDLRHFTFVDLGCGKGRVLLLASQFGFKRILGVEFISKLAEIARANVVKTQTPNCTISLGDAADFQFPGGDLVVYLFSPFREKVMMKVIENLRNHDIGKLYVIYQNPECAELFDASGFLVRLGRPSGRLQIWRKREAASLSQPPAAEALD